jgi:hypothetical protein
MSYPVLCFNIPNARAAVATGSSQYLEDNDKKNRDFSKHHKAAISKAKQKYILWSLAGTMSKKKSFYHGPQ